MWPESARGLPLGYSRRLKIENWISSIPRSHRKRERERERERERP
jgi:hypothetical protein